ncbi:hypothetical protein GC105_10755 [Alkalibaculum sp. M08DMB]|uniref:Lipoprotein n=1 Tax=Alkalibaculum sporogenes TaxID=2655001 RepID=A0A6A7KAQ6_9FIRM|nr:hypothetical protein [Alkalibaculum sporogenes]MPW26267.1 hypothetical protein [Alkalibaculum sporogenes]
MKRILLIIFFVVLFTSGCGVSESEKEKIKEEVKAEIKQEEQAEIESAKELGDIIIERGRKEDTDGNFIPTIITENSEGAQKRIIVDEETYEKAFDIEYIDSSKYEEFKE